MERKLETYERGQCDKCSKKDVEIRNLMLTCFYDLSELNLPLKAVGMQGAYVKLVQKLDVGAGRVVPVFEGIPDAQQITLPLFCMNVCLRCRADFIIWLKQWFADMPDNLNIN